MESPAPFAEVMESALHTLHAECWKWDQPPAFGQLIRINDAAYPLYAIVTSINTGPRDQHRTPMALQKTQEELRREYPHIFHLLHTRFTAVIIGHYANNSYIYQAAPHPSQMHTFIQPASSSEYHAILSHEAYISLLFHASELDASIDELMLAIIRHMQSHNALSKERIKRIIDTFSMLINNDYRRLKLLLQRIEHLRNA